eukprot:scaffold9557_cov85-Skeletonema_marinoi.AAC.2
MGLAGGSTTCNEWARLGLEVAIGYVVQSFSVMRSLDGRLVAKSIIYGPISSAATLQKSIIIMWSSTNNHHHPPLSISGLNLFFTLLLTTLTLSNNASGLKLFTHPHGRIHRLTGLFHLLWLLYGALFLINNNHYTQNGKNDWHMKCLVYDITLGTSGIITTLTAASSFPHRHILNRPGESGTLSNDAIVTQAIWNVAVGDVALGNSETLSGQ